MKAILEYLLGKNSKTTKEYKITIDSTYDEILKTLYFYEQKELNKPNAADDFIMYIPEDNVLWIYKDKYNGISIKFVCNDIMYVFSFKHTDVIQRIDYVEIKTWRRTDCITDKMEIQKVLDKLNKDLN